MKHFNRRDLIKSFSLFAGASTFSGWLPVLKVLAQTAQEDHFFVMVTMIGGWDISLSLDPWTGNSWGYHGQRPNESDMFIEYADSEVYREPGTQFYLGPAAKSLIPYVSRAAIINGVVVVSSDNGHDAALNYMITGSGKGDSASIPVDLALATRAGAYGVIFNSDLPMGLRAIQSSTTYQISLSRNYGDPSAMLNLRSQNSLTQSVRGRAQQAVVSSQGARSALIKELTQQKVDQDTENQDAIIAAASFASGISNQAYLKFSSFNLDSHSGHVGDHLRAQTQAWEKFSNMLKVFDRVQNPRTGRSVLDDTTFLVTSEFARTPALNVNKGKDHNPHTNSVLLLGKGIRGGTIAGQSAVIPKLESHAKMPLHIGRPIYLESGEPVLNPQHVYDKKGFFIRPENVVATVSKIFGANPAKFSALRPNTFALDSVVKT